MIKKDAIKELRIAWVDVLKTLRADAFQNVYYEVAPLSSTPLLDPYVIVKSIITVDDSDKNSYDVRASVLIDLSQEFAGNINSTEINRAADEIMQAINEDIQLTLTNFICHKSELVSNNVLTERTETGSWAKRLMRFEHFLEQVA